MKIILGIDSSIATINSKAIRIATVMKAKMAKVEVGEVVVSI